MGSLVLVVDDDDLMRSTVAAELRHSGLSTVEACSGKSALETLSHEHVEAVLVDNGMPEMTGLELTRRIRDLPLHRLTPVLFLSADDSSETRLRALRTGATDYMTKPLDLEEVAARIQAQLHIATAQQSRISELENRAGTVSELTAVPTGGDLELVARSICCRISRRHDDTGVAIFSWECDSRLSLLAAANWCSTPEPDMTTVLDLRGHLPAWIHHPAQTASRSGWWACAPLRHGTSHLGVLAIKGTESDRQELLAAAVDYAGTAALHLGSALRERRRAGDRCRALEKQLSEGGFEPVFQPIVDLRAQEVIGYEALTRLSNGQPVIEFLAEADEAHIRPRCELTLASGALARAAALNPDVWVSINISPSVLVEESERLADVVSYASGRVVIELTENERIEDYSAVRQALDRLGDSVKLSIDDTGSGYASLRHTIDLKPHFVKLDRSWISGLDHDDTRQALVAGMVAFCEHSGADLIAEGVETEGEREALTALGVVYGQGYLLGRPAPLEV